MSPVANFSYPTAIRFGAGRIGELAEGHDRTDEVEPDTLRASALKLSSDVGDIRGADFFIVTVPTPVDAANRPDLSALRSACAIVTEGSFSSS